MPEVNGKKFPYTEAGKKAAAKAKKEVAKTKPSKMKKYFASSDGAVKM